MTGRQSRSWRDLVGYLDHLVVDPGDSLELKVSSRSVTAAEARIVLLAPGTRAELVCPAPSRPFDVGPQVLTPGSFGLVEDFGPVRSPHVVVWLYPTLASAGDSGIVGTWDAATRGGWALFDRGGVGLRVGSATCVVAGDLELDRWHFIEAQYDAETGEASVSVATPAALGSPARRPRRRTGSSRLPPRLLDDLSRRPLIVAGLLDSGQPTAALDGRIAGLTVADGDRPVARWDFGAEPESRVVRDFGPDCCHLVLHQTPARAVPGPRWDGSIHDWRVDGSHYDAVHFHSDDLTDAEWSTDAVITVPHDAPNGLFAVEVKTAEHRDEIPFYVARPRRGATVCFLSSTATYMAYGNQRLEAGGFASLDSSLPLTLKGSHGTDVPEAGPSLYEPHRDGSGTFFASRRRPIVDWRSGGPPWGFGMDRQVWRWLDAEGTDFDVLTDEQLHRDGVAALDGCGVLVTGAHPEYWSTSMLDALCEWLARGGRLMALGANGFYWRTAFSPEDPGIVEVRRAEDGTRPWIAQPGEYHHAFTGELGGMWRRVGRPPNVVSGVGFSGQGFGPPVAHQVNPAARIDLRTSWILSGTSGGPRLVRSDGADASSAGLEIDRFDVRLGSPPHGVIIASTSEFDPSMRRAKEELFATGAEPDDGGLRSDVVFFETDSGGAVFSTGSIAWANGLDDGGSDVALMTRNVLRRFVEPMLFSAPDLHHSSEVLGPRRPT